MKALTIRQPWASLIAAGVKTIETRSWKTSYRGPIAIHAGKRDGFMAGLYGRGMYGDADALWKLPDAGFGDERLHDPRRYEDAFEVIGSAPLGAVVATATLLDCVPIIGSGEEQVPSSFVTEYEDENSTLPHQQGGLWLIGVNNLTAGRPTRIGDQRPLGDFTPGRYAWLLTEIEPCDPVPAKGKQGLWEVEL